VGGDCGEPAGDLAAADAGEQASGLDLDAGVDEGCADPLCELLQLVGGLGAAARVQGDVVDLVDEYEVGTGAAGRSQA
jgi:hypothetical protein